MQRRFEDEAYYRTDDPALGLIGTLHTLRQWRHEGKGPAYIKLGGRVLYRGHDLNKWLDAHLVEPGGAT